MDLRQDDSASVESLLSLIYKGDKKQEKQTVRDEDFEAVAATNVGKASRAGFLKKGTSNGFGYNPHVELFALAARLDTPCLKHLCAVKLHQEMHDNWFFEKWRLNHSYRSSAVLLAAKRMYKIVSDANREMKDMLLRSCTLQRLRMLRTWQFSE